MSTQVVRVEGFKRSSLNHLRKELQRDDYERDNIDQSRTQYNITLVDGGKDLLKRYDVITQDICGEVYKDTKSNTLVEGTVITAEADFFEQLGYEKGKPIDTGSKEFFDKSYKWLIEQVGYRHYNKDGTYTTSDKNILDARIHLDETSLHLQVLHIPITEHFERKVYEKDANNLVKRNERGAPIQAKDDKGKLMKEVVDGASPRVAKADFWRERGGATSYTKMQDSFHKAVGKAYGLERGEVGSTKEHETQHQYQYQKQLKELQSLSERVAELTEQERLAVIKAVEIPPRPVTVTRIQKPDLPRNPKTIPYWTDEDYKSYKSSMRVYKKECKSIDSKNKKIDSENALIAKRQAEWDNMYALLQTIKDEAARLDEQDRQQQQRGQELSEQDMQQQQRGRELSTREQHLDNEIKDKVNAGVRKQLDHSEKLRDISQTCKDWNERYSMLFNKDYEVKGDVTNDNQSIEGKQDVYTKTATKQVGRD